jgi:pyruvate kinase
MGLPAHKTKLICTIGPASASIEIMEQMLRAGMNIARLNFSHGDFSSHKKVIENLRRAARSAGQAVGILADLPGPKIRIGQFQAEPVELKQDATFILTTKEVPGNAQQVSVSFARLPQVVKPGDILFLNDGFIQLSVLEIKAPDVICKVIIGGELRSRKGLNLPGIDLGISAFTERDAACLACALENGVDAISQSFVESAADIAAVRKAAAALGHEPFIIAKIERSRALDHLDEILEAADAVMIARGDLGVEIPIEQIAAIQKKIILRANLLGKPVITATQMLESMTGNRRPTRAEATDVANAILDGTDCVMLSEESATGHYPVEAVAMLAKIAAAIEPQQPAHQVRTILKAPAQNTPQHLADLIALSVDTTIEHAEAALVFVPTRTGATARSIGRFRLPIWIAAISSHEATCQQLQFSYGIYPVHEQEHPENWNLYIRKFLPAHNIRGDVVLLTEGPSAKHPEANSRMEIIDFRRG